MKFSDEFIYNFFFINDIIVSKRCNKKYIDKHCVGLYEYLYNRFDDILEDATISEILFRINNNIEHRPKCPVCGAYLKYKHGFYPSFCSKKCKWSEEGLKIEREKACNTMEERYGVRHALLSPEILQKQKDNNIKKYGVENVFASEEVKEKIKQTCTERYGYYHPCKSEAIKLKILDTMYKRYYSGTDEANILKERRANKAKLTCLKHYGVEHPLLCELLLNKSKLTCLKHYGVEYYVTTSELRNIVKEKVALLSGGKYTTYTLLDEVKEKTKLTCLLKYGVEYIMQSDIFKEKSKQTCLEKYGVEHSTLRDEIQDKIKKTCLEKYGVDNVFKSPIIKDRIKQTCLLKYGVPYITLDKDFKLRGYLTALKNKSFTGKSKIEEETHEILNDIFGCDNVLYNARISSKYPYKIDFFIKTVNLYIEINAFWKHGPYPYREDDKECIDLLNNWKEKEKELLLIYSSTYYTEAIKLWTYYDVNRRNIAYKNNLRYLEIFSNNVIDVIFSLLSYFNTLVENTKLLAYYNFNYDKEFYTKEYMLQQLKNSVKNYNEELDNDTLQDIELIEMNEPVL